MKSRGFLTFRMWISYGLGICFVGAAINGSRTRSVDHAVADLIGDMLTALIGIAFLVDGTRVMRHLKERDVN
jgi:hypothetical protein